MSQSKELMLKEIAENTGLELNMDECWTTEEVTQAFEITGFLAPFCVARNRETGKKGTLLFIHRPRIYYGWEEA